jgi:hypothetical protein
LRDESTKRGEMSDTEQKASLSSSQWMLIFLILAVSAGSVMYHVIVRGRLEQTAALFVGIPSLLAILLAMTPKAKTIKGGVMKGLTLALLLSGPLLGEGFICILMASPIFFIVGILVAAIVDWNREKRQTTLSCLVLILLPLSIEGTSPKLSFNREETVQASEVVPASEQQVRAALSHSPRTAMSLPIYLRMGFPRPIEARGQGLELGACRTIHFAGGEGRPGDLRLKVTESRPGYVRFDAVSDSSKIAHWLDWKSSEVDWTALDAQHTRVNWTLHFERRLDPAWYFRRWERYATHLAAAYLIRANATPAPEKQGE